MIRVLSICSSRRRPEGLKKMIESFYATRTDDRTKLVFYLSHEDPDIDRYEKITRNCERVIGKPRCLTEIMNYLTTRVFPDIPYYHEVNDDHTFMTKGWDEVFIEKLETEGNGWGVVCGNNMGHGVPAKEWFVYEHPSACMVSGNIIRTLGYFVWPGIRHIYTDTYLRDLGKMINRLYYMHEVEIFHFHEKEDPNYPDIYKKSAETFGLNAYNDWMKNHKNREQRRLMDCMRAEKGSWNSQKT